MKPKLKTKTAERCPFPEVSNDIIKPKISMHQAIKNAAVMKDVDWGREEDDERTFKHANEGAHLKQTKSYYVP